MVEGAKEVSSSLEDTTVCMLGIFIKMMDGEQFGHSIAA